jgi:hypothetical protein
MQPQQQALSNHQHSLENNMTVEKNSHHNLPASLSDQAANILKQTTRANPLLRFVTGKYKIGEDEIAAGREYVVFPMEWTRGWTKWHDGQIVAGSERLGKVAAGFVPCEREELGDTDPSQWEDEDSDPWQMQNMLPLEDAETGEFVVFVSSSFGGKMAIEKLCNRVARDLNAGRNLGNPTIKLGIAEFSTKKYGKVSRPEFTIISWENEDAPLPPIKDAVGDEVPF